jgi:hypothetical protein
VRTVPSSLAVVSLGWVLEELRPTLTDSVIRRSVSHEAFRRGAAYADAGRVLDLARSCAVDRFDATVVGSGGRLYRTVAAYDAGSARWWGECSCPVGEDCKHVAAVLITAWDSLARTVPAAVRVPDWETALADLVQPAAPPGQRAGTPLGLQFDVEPTRAGGPFVRLPGRTGAKGRWIRTGVSWRELALDASLVDEAHAGIRSSKADAFLEHLQEVVAEGHRAGVQRVHRLPGKGARGWRRRDSSTPNSTGARGIGSRGSTSSAVGALLSS